MYTYCFRQTEKTKVMFCGKSIVALVKWYNNAVEYILWTRIYVDEEVQAVLGLYFYVLSHKENKQPWLKHTTRGSRSIAKKGSSLMIVDEAPNTTYLCI